jgi:hypothetical protein
LPPATGELAFSWLNCCVILASLWSLILHWIDGMKAPRFSLSTAVLQACSQVVSELQRIFPGIASEWSSAMIHPRPRKSELWQDLLRWRNDHSLPAARQGGWLDYLLDRARDHPRHVRLLAYRNPWRAERNRKSTLPYPCFQEWQEAADQYVKARRH